MKHLKTYESVNFLKLKDLAEIISRQFGDYVDDYYQYILDSLIDAYKNEGDKGVIELFKYGTKSNLEPMGFGRYIIK